MPAQLATRRVNPPSIRPRHHAIVDSTPIVTDLQGMCRSLSYGHVLTLRADKGKPLGQQ